VMENGTVEVDAMNQKCMFFSEADGKGHEVYFGDNMDMGLVANFAAAVEGREEVAATGEDGLRSLEMALGAYESARTGQPVALPLEG